MKTIARRTTSFILFSLIVSAALFAAEPVEYKLLATNKTSTSQQEMNEAAEAGFHFEGVMGGDTAFGGSQVVTIMSRRRADEKGRFVYKLLATSQTSTMQREMQEAGNEGFEYKGQTVFRSSFGGGEVVIILELDRNKKERPHFEYKLLATKKTSTMQKELAEAGATGYEFVGLTVGDTALGGAEVISILRRERK